MKKASLLSGLLVLFLFVLVTLFFYWNNPSGKINTEKKVYMGEKKEVNVNEGKEEVRVNEVNENVSNKNISGKNISDKKVSDKKVSDEKASDKKTSDKEEYSGRAEYLVIDRFEGNFAVCENEDGEMLNIDISKLPEEAKEGHVLKAVGDKFEIDYNETERRISRILKLMEDLRED